MSKKRKKRPSFRKAKRTLLGPGILRTEEIDGATVKLRIPTMGQYYDLTAGTNDPHAMLRAVLEFTVVGWENRRDADGNPIPFSAEEVRALAGPPEHPFATELMQRFAHHMDKFWKRLGG